MSSSRRFLALAVALAGLTAAPAFAVPVAPAAPAQGPRASETVQNPAADSPDATVAGALQAALDGSFAKYLALVHPEERETDEQRKQRERYEWARFRKQVGAYVASEKPLTFAVARRLPEGEDRIKLFIKDQKMPQRMPPPIRLRKTGGKWYILSNSL